jgi:glycine reductase complex component B subunit alpha and beta
MRLMLASASVRRIETGRARLTEGVLTVDPDAVVSAVREVPGISAAALDVVAPGDSTRIVHALDAVEPRLRPGGGGAYPGVDGPVAIAGEGETRRLAGAAVIVCCEVPWRNRGGLLLPREGIIDMSGPGAMYSPFGGTHNIVVTLSLVDNLDDEGCEHATRIAGFRAAARVADVLQSARDLEGEAFELAPAPGLPSVVYVYQIQSQALWARTFLYGQPLDDQLPLLLHPNEILDGALASGNQVYQNHKIPTWLHANSPVVRELYARHGRDLNFRGVILSRGYFYSDEAKQRSALFAARLAAHIGADGAVVTWEGGGNSMVEAMLTVQACERRGIRTSLIAYEMSTGDGAPLLFSVPEADAIVASANTEAPVRLPAVDRVVGGDAIRLRPEVGGVRVPAAGPLALEATYEMYCAANRVGAGQYEVVTW